MVFCKQWVSVLWRKKMRKVIFFFIGMIFLSNWIWEAKGQEREESFQYFFFSADKVERCDWSESSKQFDKNCNVLEAPTLFRLNKDQSMFTLTSEENQSIYHVKSREYNEEYAAMLYIVTSDIEENKYLFILDIDDDLIKVVPMSGQDKGSYLLLFYVNEAWEE